MFYRDRLRTGANIESHAVGVGIINHFFASRLATLDMENGKASVIKDGKEDEEVDEETEFVREELH